MPYQFSKHYTREEARSLIPNLRQWLKQLQELRGSFAESERSLSRLLAAGHDVGGPEVHRWIRTLVAIKELLGYFRQREIQIKDLERGLLDFPALRGGKEVFLCWELEEEDIEFWHDLNSGYSGREPI